MSALQPVLFSTDKWCHLSPGDYGMGKLLCCWDATWKPPCTSIVSLYSLHIHPFVFCGKRKGRKICNRVFSRNLVLMLCMWLPAKANRRVMYVVSEIFIGWLLWHSDFHKGNCRSTAKYHVSQTMEIKVKKGEIKIESVTVQCSTKVHLPWRMHSSILSA